VPEFKKVRSTTAATTALVAALALFVSACGGGDSKAATPEPTTTTVAPTTTTVAPPTAPLTGLIDPGGASHGRPALSVKVENTDAARPQTGIDQGCRERTSQQHHCGHEQQR